MLFRSEPDIKIEAYYHLNRYETNEVDRCCGPDGIYAGNIFTSALAVGLFIPAMRRQAIIIITRPSILPSISRSLCTCVQNVFVCKCTCVFGELISVSIYSLVCVFLNLGNPPPPHTHTHTHTPTYPSTQTPTRIQSVEGRHWIRRCTVQYSG